MVLANFNVLRLEVNVFFATFVLWLEQHVLE